MKSNRILVAGALALGLVALGSVPEAQTLPPKVIRQNMPIVALQNGHFQESISIGEAKAQGDLGIGAMASLDGEVVNVEGVIYQFQSNGVVRVPPNSERLSFSSMTRFRPTRPVSSLPAGTSLAGLGPLLDPTLPTLNTFYAASETMQSEARSVDA
jgi:acetolactate decarboxylase